ncbi:barstar family protein [Denitromonas iodatirespirans]|uniref:Barstar family protein n=1 Tax=Denitromonas iodatirespirans TaxID=2795389 RepID=A0A944D8Q0_DENI1|nr:barstar family protein [Denitromonas iodatirespirans]MBT0960571.1 barstar family protein [Denitromonas iodatirespirans]
MSASPPTGHDLALDGENRLLPLSRDELGTLVATAQARQRRIFELSLAGLSDKASILDALAQCFDMPRWFGHNWDALYDCLTDLSWLPASGYVLILLDAAPDSDSAPILTDILTDCCEHWQAQGVPFHVFSDGVHGTVIPREH